MPVRISLDLAQPSVDLMHAIKDKTDATSCSEVVRRALRSYERLVDAWSKGEKVMLRNDDTDYERELIAG